MQLWGDGCEDFRGFRDKGIPAQGAAGQEHHGGASWREEGTEVPSSAPSVGLSPFASASISWHFSLPDLALHVHFRSLSGELGSSSEA